MLQKQQQQAIIAYDATNTPGSSQENFLALLQTPEVKRRSRAHGGGGKDTEQCALSSLLSLPAYHSEILGVRHQCYDL
jgi:hypothetical protein